MVQNNVSCDWLLIADGEPLTSVKLQALADKKKVLVLDGAYQYVKKTGVHIDVLLGDFDSIDKDALSDARDSEVIVVDAPDQNKTDLEKGINYIDQFKPARIFIAGATGLRLQHTLFNLRMLKKYNQLPRELILITEIEVIRYFENTEINLHGNVNDSVAILGFPNANITTQGLQYDVTNYALQFEESNSISNSLVAKQANINITGSVLIIHEVMDVTKSSFYPT